MNEAPEHERSTGTRVRVVVVAARDVAQALRHRQIRKHEDDEVGEGVGDECGVGLPLPLPLVLGLGVVAGDEAPDRPADGVAGAVAFAVDLLLVCDVAGCGFFVGWPAPADDTEPGVEGAADGWTTPSDDGSAVGFAPA